MPWLTKDRSETGSTPFERSMIAGHGEGHIGRLDARSHFWIRAEEAEEVGVSAWIEHDLG